MQALLALLAVEGPSAQLGQLGAGQGPDLTRYFAVLGILLAAVLGLAFGFKKLFSGALRAKAARRHLAVVDLLPLGGKQRLAVVRCYDRTFALGLGDKEIALIAELDPVHAEGRGLRLPDAAERAEFARILETAGAQATSISGARATATSGAQATATSGAQSTSTSGAQATATRKAQAASASATAPTIGRRLRELLGTRGVLG